MSDRREWNEGGLERSQKGDEVRNEAESETTYHQQVAPRIKASSTYVDSNALAAESTGTTDSMNVILTISEENDRLGVRRVGREEKRKWKQKLTQASRN